MQNQKIRLTPRPPMQLGDRGGFGPSGNHSNHKKQKGNKMTEKNIKQNDDNTEYGAVGIIWLSVSGVHRSYQSRAREAGKVVLEIKDFWNKFRRRFPGSDWGWAKWGTDDEYNIGRAVYVRLRPTDSTLAAERECDGFFTSDGHDAVLATFIRDQDLFSGEPHQAIFPDLEKDDKAQAVAATEKMRTEPVEPHPEDSGEPHLDDEIPF